MTTNLPSYQQDPVPEPRSNYPKRNLTKMVWMAGLGVVVLIAVMAILPDASSSNSTMKLNYFPLEGSKHPETHNKKQSDTPEEEKFPICRDTRDLSTEKKEKGHKWACVVAVQVSL